MDEQNTKAAISRAEMLARQVAQMSEREKAEFAMALERQKWADSPQADYTLGNTAGRPLEEPFPSGDFGLRGYSSQELSLNNIEDAMEYRGWGPEEVERGNQVRETLLLAAKAILRNVPRSPRRTLALQHLISARMDANMAITFGGRF